MEVYSELTKAQLENRDTDYAHNAQTRGLTWFNKAANKAKMIYNSVVEILATESWVTEQINTVVGNVESGTTVATSFTTSEQSVDPSTPASGNRKIFSKSTGIHELGSDGIAYLLERATVNKVKELVVEEWRYTNSDGSTSDNDETVGNCPTGWAWMFVASCRNTESQSGNWEGRNITFDGNTFTPATVPTSAVQGKTHTPTVFVFGTGTAGGNIVITFHDDNHYHSGAGLFIRWKVS